MEMYVQHTASRLRFDDILHPVHWLVPPQVFVLSYPEVTRRVLLREPLWTGNCVLSIWNVTNTAPSAPKPPGCCETLRARIATERHVRHMPSVVIHVTSHSVHRSHDRWYSVSTEFCAAVLLYYWSWSYSPMPSMFQPHTFLTSLGRTKRSYLYLLWPIRYWGG